MRKAVNRLVRRPIARLQHRLEARYRQSLQGDPTAVFRLLLVAVAIVDRLAATTRRIAGAGHELRRWRGRILAGRLRLAGRADLVVTAAVIGAPDQLSVRVTGPATQLARATHLRLVRSDGTSPPLDLPTTATRSADGVRLAARLPQSAFTTTGATWRVLAGDATAAVVDQSALPERWPGRRRQSWPPRLAVDDQRRLIVTATAPGQAGIEHSVEIGVVTATVIWTGNGAGRLRLEREHEGPSLLVPTAPGPQSAVVDLAALVAHGDGVWQSSVQHGDAADDWDDLQLPVGAYAALPSLAEVPVRRAGGAPAWVLVGYSTTNRLTFTVRTER